MLVRGVDTALIGIILCITPALGTLSLTTLDSPLYYEQDKNNAVWAEVENLFELISRHVSLSDCFQGLSSLTRLSTNGRAPSSWLSLPRLEAARFDLFEDPLATIDYANTMTSHITPGATVSTTLTRLVIQPEFESLYCYEATHMEGVYGQFRSVVSGLPNLTHLFILYRAVVDPYDEFRLPHLPRGSFAHIVSHLKSCSLTDLTLDVEPALKDLVRYIAMIEYIHDTTPMTTFAGLPKLRSLNAPQDAFFSAKYGTFRTCRLPTTIEKIGIMDSTYETKRYLKHLLDRQTEWPNLKTIKLGESPCNDQSVHPDESDDDASESDAGERRKLSEVDDSIYEQARSRDLRVEKVQDRTAWKKGWEGLGL
ncbi:uncharacterized protein J4E92_004166 [Alternaria infectoria]|uniref:uncharacterized protein n=1 Tax=Alternaria viburni TaxID=566460 RepID=UPI0020C1C318|nr:uncharacterized protein J4E79_001679 [Alternaria viburni]XP_051354577.1 uncharacterized protein J4E92_004166 [Alternaria infectoria]KAI4666998.1 hypothetical protein J4E79_001679 [Alternaria viburni]KAI4932266.1 hypothetical protein J4E92_004166 [Alternaria infectoria]